MFWLGASSAADGRVGRRTCRPGAAPMRSALFRARRSGPRRCVRAPLCSPPGSSRTLHRRVPDALPGPSPAWPLFPSFDGGFCENRPPRSVCSTCTERPLPQDLVYRPDPAARALAGPGPATEGSSIRWLLQSAARSASALACRGARSPRSRRWCLGVRGAGRALVYVSSSASRRCCRLERALTVPPSRCWQRSLLVAAAG